MNDDNITLPDDEPDQPTQIQPPIDDESGDPPESAPEPVILTCAECGEPIEEDQPYCLECGAPTPTAPKLRRRLGPAGILAIGLGVLGIGAGTLAYALSKDDNPTAIASTDTTTGPVSLPSVSSLPSTFSTPTTPSVDLTDTPTADFPATSTDVPPVDPSLTVTSTPSVTSTPTETTPPPDTETIDPGTSSDVDTWPDGVAGWTVILASATDQAAAISFRDRVTGTGRAAGLIESDLYASLEPGLWVVWTGQHSDRSTAISQAAALRATYKDAYAQRIEEL